MAEYIEREKAIELFYPVDPENDGSDGTTVVTLTRNYSSADIESMLSDMPAEDVAPVRRGRWILEREPNGKPYCFHCSVCDDDFHYIGITVAYDYCPNCGAKMDLEV